MMVIITMVIVDDDNSDDSDDDDGDDGDDNSDNDGDNDGDDNGDDDSDDMVMMIVMIMATIMATIIATIGARLETPRHLPGSKSLKQPLELHQQSTILQNNLPPKFVSAVHQRISSCLDPNSPL